MMALLRSICSLALLVPGVTEAAVDSAVKERFSLLPGIKEEAWKNPAMLESRFRLSLSETGGGLFYSPIDRYGVFSANSYIHLGKTTVNALAEYHNGARHDLRICENADAAMVYPYLTYDSVGGNQNLERYRFGGEVGVRLSERWSAGGVLSYKAGLYYRNRDPRPRVVTGDFRIEAGGAFSFTPGYSLGLSAGYSKYKQSCGITFMSDLGASRLYHLTGLGTHYFRFAGKGLAVLYSGHSFSGGMTLLPGRNGLYADAFISKREMTHVLEDINNLPMSRIDTRSFYFTAGWIFNNSGIKVYSQIIRRHGYENIFGDAASGQFPQIGSLCMYLLNRTEVGLRAAYEHHPGNIILSSSAHIGWTKHSEHYRDPPKDLSLQSLSASVLLKALVPISKSVLAKVSATWNPYFSLSSDVVNIYSLPGLENFMSSLNDDIHRLSNTFHGFHISIGTDILISKGKFAIGADISLSKDIISGRSLTGGASFKF